MHLLKITVQNVYVVHWYIHSVKQSNCTDGDGERIESRKDLGKERGRKR